MLTIKEARYWGVKSVNTVEIDGKTYVKLKRTAYENDLVIITNKNAERRNQRLAYGSIWKVTQADGTPKRGIWGKEHRLNADDPSYIDANDYRLLEEAIPVDPLPITVYSKQELEALEATGAPIYDPNPHTVIDMTDRLKQPQTLVVKVPNGEYVTICFFNGGATDIVDILYHGTRGTEMIGFRKNTRGDDRIRAEMYSLDIREAHVGKPMGVVKKRGEE